jgi:tetratricopeptide (TPR) repeat protein
MPDAHAGGSPVDELAEEFARRWRDGERPSVEEYATRFPQWAADIRELFPAVLLMEQLKPQPGDRPTESLPPGPAGPVPERLGDYRILREIGRGGMGVVYEAEQLSLGRRVALKVLPANLLASERVRSRFRREAQAAARLHHTNIVPVFAVGEQDGLCFYAMQRIAGKSLDTAPAQSPPGPEWTHRTVAQIGVQAADALAYAHSQGVLHRDVKPSNLLLDERGAIWVTDFGVAKLLEEANLTQPGEVVGTLSYMPPERFQGQSDARGDVYSLGITLYELLARRPAFPDADPHQLIHRITHAEPPRLRSLDPTIPTDLETIVSKAAARDPAHRYQTAGELADDLRRFLDDRPVLARRVGTAGQVWRWCRRNRLVAASAAAALGLLLVTTVVSVTAYVQTAAASRETAAANGEMRKALAAEQAERERAEQMSASALGTLNRIYEEFAPNRIVVTPGLPAESGTEDGLDLPPQPVLSPGVVPLLEELLGFYEQFARSGSDYPRLQGQAAAANQRIGDIRQRLGQFEPAIAAYRKALELYTRLPPTDAAEAARIKTARTYNELGRALRALQRTDEAEDAHVQALQTLTTVPKEVASRPECRYELARTYYLQSQRGPLAEPGRPDRERGRGPDGPGRGRPPFLSKGGPPFPVGGGPPTQRAITLLEELVKEHGSVPEYRHLLACCYRDIPPMQVVNAPVPMGWGAARAIDLLRQLIKDFPQVPDFRCDLCETIARVGYPGLRQQRASAAAAWPLLEEAHTHASDLAAKYPNVPQYTAAYAQVLDKVGRALHELHKLEEAEQTLRKAVALQTGLVKQHPEIVAYDLGLALAQTSLAGLLGDRGNSKEARSLLETAAKRLDALTSRVPRLGSVRMGAGRTYRELAQVLTRLGESKLAEEAARKAEAFGPDRGPPGPRKR